MTEPADITAVSRGVPSRRSLVFLLTSLAAACSCPAVDADTDLPVGIGAGFGYALHGEDAFVHGRELRLLVQARRGHASLQPRVEFLSQHFDLDASRLDQPTVDGWVTGGDQSLHAGLAGLQWSLGQSHRVRPYVLGEVGYAWQRRTVVYDQQASFSEDTGAWMTSGGGGLEMRLGEHAALIEGRYSHRYEDEFAVFPARAWSMSAGFVF